MSDFLAKARAIQRENGCTFYEACSILGRASGRKRKARAGKKEEGKKRGGEGERIDWHTRWERERERRAEAE